MRRREVFHWLFLIATIVKGIDGVIEAACGVLLGVTSVDWLHSAVFFVTRREIAEDPADAVSQALRAWAEQLSVEGKRFIVLYLLGHGLLKVVLSLALLDRKPALFPAALTLLGLFIAYEAYRLSIGFSGALLAVTLFDVLVFAAALRERRTLVDQA